MTIKEQLVKKDVECGIKDQIIKELLDRLEKSGVAPYQPPIIIERHYPQPYHWHIGPYWMHSTGVSNGTSFSITNEHQGAHSSGYLELTNNG